jgi:hypothetical protein
MRGHERIGRLGEQRRHRRTISLRCPGAGVTNEERKRMDHWFAAYIDAGAGSLIVQATIAAVVAVPFYLRRQIARAARLVLRRGARAESADRRTAS